MRPRTHARPPGGAWPHSNPGVRSRTPTVCSSARIDSAASIDLNPSHSDRRQHAAVSKHGIGVCGDGPCRRGVEGPAAEDRQPRGSSAVEYHAAHGIRRTRLLVARRAADCLHVEKLRRRLRRRHQDEDDPLADALPESRLPPRPVPAERRSFSDRRPRVCRHPDHALT